MIVIPSITANMDVCRLVILFINPTLQMPQHHHRHLELQLLLYLCIQCVSANVLKIEIKILT